MIEHREALIYMLCQAAELEHGIMCQYLYAAFSLKQSQDEGLTAEEEKAVKRWRKQISHVATQEMLHLSLVQNLLSAIGAAPHLSRPNFPQPARHYPAGVHLTLLPFGEAALRHFMFLERPEGMDIQDAAGMAAFRRAAPAMQHGEIVPRGQDFATVGHLYRSIEAGVAHLAEKYGEQWLFVGPPRAQATQPYFGWPELVAVTDVASAQRAIDEILEQGEGPRGHWQSAHFGQFVAILDEYIALREANPAFDPVRPVVPVNVRQAERDTDIPLVSDPVTGRVMDAFNVSYEILLLMLQRFFAHTEETDPQLKALADATIALMFGALKPLGDLVTTLPGRPRVPEPDGRAELRAVLRVRLRAAAPRGGLGPAHRAPPPGRRLLRTRRPLRPRGDRRPGRRPVQPGRDRRRPRRPPAGPLRRPRAPAEDPAILLARAADFDRTGLALASHDDPTLARVAALRPPPTRPREPTQATPARSPAWSTASCARSPIPCPTHRNRPSHPPSLNHPRNPRRHSGMWRSLPPRCGRSSAPALRPGCSRRSRRCRTWPSGKRPRASGLT